MSGQLLMSMNRCVWREWTIWESGDHVDVIKSGLIPVTNGSRDFSSPLMDWVIPSKYFDKVIMP